MSAGSVGVNPNRLNAMSMAVYETPIPIIRGNPTDPFYSANGPTSASQLIWSPFLDSTCVLRLLAKAVRMSSISNKRPAAVFR